MNGAGNSHLAYLDCDFNFVRVNEAYAKTCGYRPEEMVGKNHFALYPHEENETIFARVRDTGVPVEFHDKPFVFPDQPERGLTYWDWTLNPVKDGSGGVIGLVFSLVETTERKRMEERLKDSERRLTEIIESLPDATFALDNAGLIIAWNKAMENLTGALAVDVLGKGNQEHTYRLYGQRIPCLADVVLNGAQPEWSFLNVIQEHDIVKAETYIPHLKPDGVWLSIKVAPLYDAQGNIVGVIDSCRDITERKRMEEALRESEKRFSSAFEYATIGMALVSPEGKWLKVNRATCDLLGYTENELLTRTFQDITHPDDLAADLDRVRQMLAGEISTYQMEKRYFHKKGHVVWALLSVSLVRNERDEPPYFISQIMDITDRKRTEAALRESEESERRRAMDLETVLQAVPAVVWTAHDPDSRHITGNRAADELLRLPYGTEASLTAPEDLRPTYFKILKDGRELTGDELPVQMAARGAIVRDFEYSLAFNDGVVCHMLGNAMPLLDEHGRPRGQSPPLSISPSASRRKMLCARPTSGYPKPMPPWRTPTGVKMNFWRCWRMN